MGKGGGRGQGKGGCECFEAMHAFACCVCLLLVGGPILIAIGASILAAAARNNRARSIDAVQAAVGVWDSPTSPAGWQTFQRLALYAELRPGPGLSAAAAASCGNISRVLQADSGPSDVYTDESRRFQGVRQLRFSLPGLDYRDFFMCQRQVTLLQQLPGSGVNRTLAVLPAAADPTVSYSILVDKAVGPRPCPTRSDTCGFGANFRNCRYNCEEYFGATFSCSGGTFSCFLPSAYYNNFAVKVAFSAASGAYVPDFTSPGAGGGANAMPAGFVRQFTPGNFSGGPAAGPVFQLRNITTGGLPPSFSITVRSSADPWLAYMQATGGSGYFGVAKRTLVASGVVLVVVGSLGTTFWCFALFYAWRLLCSRRRPTSRPAGMGGYAWDLANRYGGSYAAALGVPVHTTGPDGMPTAQPLYAAQGHYSHEPADGQPVQGYPYAYPPYGQAPGAGPYGQAAPPPGGYPAYPPPPPPSYPPGAHVEMAQYTYAYPPAQHQHQPQGYGYAPPTTTTATVVTAAQAPPAADAAAAAAAVPPPPGGDAGATAAYSYPYPYPYAPYGQTPAAAAGPAAPPPAGAEGAPGAAAAGAAAAAGGGHTGAGPSGSGPAAPPPGYPKY